MIYNIVTCQVHPALVKWVQWSVRLSGLARTFGLKNTGITGILQRKYRRHGQKYRSVVYRRIPPVPKIQEELAVFTGITGNTGSRARPGLFKILGVYY